MPDDQPVPNSPPPPPEGEVPAPVPPPPRRRRRWLKILLAIAAVFVLLVILAPTLMSTGVGRRTLLGIVNQSIDGKVEVDDWSLGWTGGVRMQGLRVLDRQGHVVLQARRISTELSLLKTLSNGFNTINLGRTEIDSLDLTRLHFDEAGVSNYAKLAKPSSPTTPSGPSASGKKPLQLSGEFHVTNLTGSITAAGVPQTLRIAPSELTASVVNLNPVQHHLKLAYVVDDPTSPVQAAKAGTIALTGQAILFDQGRFRLQSVAEQVALNDVNLSAMIPFLAIAKIDLRVGGTANGAVQLALTPQQRSVQGDIRIARMTATGGPLGAEQLASDLQIPLAISQAQAGVWNVADLRIVSEFGTISVNGSVPESAIANLLRHHPPGQAGHLTVGLDLDRLALLARQLPRALNLLPGLQVESGTLYSKVELSMTPRELVGKLHASTRAKGVRTVIDEKTGQSRTNPVELKPIELSQDFTWRPGASGGMAFLPGGELRDVSLVFKSVFAEFTGHTGPDGSMARFTLDGQIGLAKLREELAQFVNLGNVEWAGQFTINGNSQSDPSRPDSPLDLSFTAEAKDARLAGLGGLGPITEPWLKFVARGTLNRKAGSAMQITDGVVTLQTHNPDKPTVDVLARGSLDLRTLTSSGFEIERGRIDLARASQEFGAILPALRYVPAGQVNFTVSGRYDGRTIQILADKPATVAATGLTIVRPDAKDKPVATDRTLNAKLAGTINLSGKSIVAALSALSIVAEPYVSIQKKEGEFVVDFAPESGSFQGRGGVTLRAQGHEFLPIVRAITGQSSPAANAPGHLKHGILDGELNFAQAQKNGQPATAIIGNFGSEIEVITADPGKTIRDKLAITLNSSVPGDLTQPLDIALDIKGDILRSTLSDTQLVLASATPGKKQVINTPLGMIRRLHLSVNVPQVEALQAILDSFALTSAPTPAAVATGSTTATEVKPAAEPRVAGSDVISAGAAGPPSTTQPALAAAAPLKLASGSLAITVDAERQGSTLTPHAEIQLTNWSLARGKSRYIPPEDKSNIKAVSAIELDTDGEISGAKVTSLGGQIPGGVLRMTGPIVIEKLKSKSPAVSGGVELAGRVADLLRLLETLQGVSPETYPYTGDYILVQDITTTGNALHPVGSLKVRNLAAYGARDRAKPLFTEDLLTIVNNIQIDPAAASLKIRNVSLETRSTQAINVQVTAGALADWTNQRTITEPFQANMRIDWARLWSLVQPMLDPRTVESIKLDVAGVTQERFEVAGAFPATGTDRRGNVVPLQFNNSIRFLNARGRLTLDRLSAAGLALAPAGQQPIAMNFSLDKGVALLTDFHAICNNGTLRFAAIQADLRHVDPSDPTELDPHITIVEAAPGRDGGKNPLLDRISLNPLLARGTLGKFMPLFLDAEVAAGEVTLTVNHCQDVPLSWLAKNDDRPASRRGMTRPVARSDGKAEFVLAVRNARIGNFILNRITGRPVEGDIRGSTIVIHNGIITSKLTLEINNREAMKFAGDVNFQAGVFRQYEASIPFSLFKLDLTRNVSPQLRRFVPEAVVLPFSGPINNPQFDPGAAVTRSLTSGIGKPENLLENLPGLLDGGKRPPGDQPINRRPGGEGGPADPGPRGRDDPRAPSRDENRRSDSGDRSPNRADPATLFEDLSELFYPERDPPRDPGSERIGSDRISSEPASRPAPRRSRGR